MTPFRAAAFFLLPPLTLGTVILSGAAGPLRAAAARSSEPALPGARLVGVMVNPEIASGEDANGFPCLAFQGTMAKTKLALVIDDPDGGLIGLDREASEIKDFRDDRGRALVESDAAFPPFGFGERVLNDGRRLALELEGTYAPTRGAEAIVASGTLVVRSAHEQRTSVSEFVECAKGAEISAGPYSLAVVSNGKAQWGDGYELEVETSDDLSAVIGYTAIDGRGTRYPLDVRSTMTFGGKSRLGLFCDTSIGKAKLEILAWKDAKVRKVPFDLRARIGF